VTAPDRIRRPHPDLADPRVRYALDQIADDWRRTDEVAEAQSSAADLPSPYVQPRPSFAARALPAIVLAGYVACLIAGAALALSAIHHGSH